MCRRVDLCKPKVRKTTDGSHLLTLVPLSRSFLLWRLRPYVPPKRRFTQDLQGTTSQKTALFIVTALKNFKSYIRDCTSTVYFHTLYSSIICQSFYCLTLYIVRYTAWRFGCFIPQEGTPKYHWVWGLLDPRARIDAVEKRKNVLPFSGIEPQFPYSLAQSPVSVPTRRLYQYSRL
jgi:hypothetical protein